MNLYDNEGHHTGISTTTGEVEEQIPGTYYTEFDDVKYIFTDASSTAHIVMDGYAPGTFTFNADQFVGDTLTASTTFKDIPTTPQTHATIDVRSDIMTLSLLKVDENGDGATVLTLAPELNGVVTVDTTAPVTVASTTGTPGTNGWYISSVQILLNATDTESGVKTTYFSLDGAATTTGSSISITTEGIHTLWFYSEDNAGNRETATSTVIKIDTTPPEARIGFDPMTKDLGIVGIDNLSSTTVTKTATTTLITDEAGNMTTLAFEKIFSGKSPTVGRLLSVRYGTSSPVSLPTSFAYIYDAAQVLKNQTLIADNQFIVHALYNKKTNKTMIIVLKKGIPIQMKTLSGQVLLLVKTSKGTVGYGW